MPITFWKEPRAIKYAAEVSEFLSDCCELVPGEQVPCREVFNAYATWREVSGMGRPAPTRRNTFEYAIIHVAQDRGVEQRPGGPRGTLWMGLRLQPGWDEVGRQGRPAPASPTVKVKRPPPPQVSWPVLVTAFVEQRCVVARDAEESRVTLYRAFKRWCANTGQRPIERWRFDDLIIDTVPTVGWTDLDRSWWGIELRMP